MPFPCSCSETLLCRATPSCPALRLPANYEANRRQRDGLRQIQSWNRARTKEASFVLPEMNSRQCRRGGAPSWAGGGALEGRPSESRPRPRRPLPPFAVYCPWRAGHEDGCHENKQQAAQVLFVFFSAACYLGIKDHQKPARAAGATFRNFGFGNSSKNPDAVISTNQMSFSRN
jgi:hypothetical protein